MFTLNISLTIIISCNFDEFSFCYLGKGSDVKLPRITQSNLARVFFLLEFTPPKNTKVTWRVPNPPGANPLVAERAFPTSDYWGWTGVARCAEEMTGICRDFQ